MANVFMKWEGVGSRSGQETWIPLESFQWGTGRGIGRFSPHEEEAKAEAGPRKREISSPSISEIVVTHRHDQYSLDLLRLAMSRDPAAVVLRLVERDAPGAHIVEEWRLKDTLISGYSRSVGSGGPISESISLNFTRMEVVDVETGRRHGYDTETEQPV